MTNQQVSFAAFEAVNIRTQMSPVVDITGWTLQVNIRTFNQTVVYQTSDVIFNSAETGLFTFSLSSETTGQTIGAGNYVYDIWRTDENFQTQLVSGNCFVTTQEWM